MRVPYVKLFREGEYNGIQGTVNTTHYISSR